MSVIYGNIVGGAGSAISVDATLSVEGQAADAKATGDAISQLSDEKVNKSALSLGFGTDGKLYIMVSGVPIGSGVEINGTIDSSDGVIVFSADFSGVSPFADQFYSWEGRIYDNSIYDALENIQCADGVVKLISAYDSDNSRWIKQMMCTGGLFESDNFICSFKAKFSGLAGSWNNVITYGTGTHWTNSMYSDGVKWPAGGEIDAFEQAGEYKETPNTMNTPTVHYGSGTESGYPNRHESRSTGTVEFTTDEWHDFKFSLKNGYVQIWIDEVLVGENDFSDCSVSNNYLMDYKPFLKPQAFYIDGSCASESDTSNIYEFEVSDFKIYQDENVTCTGLEIFPQMWENSTELIFPVGAELYLDRVYTPSNTSNKACTWESSNQDVATVCQGYVKCKSVGIATITATCGTVSANYELTVSENASVPCVGIQCNIPTTVTSAETLKVYKYPNFTTDAVTYESSDESVATIEDGVITPLSNGTSSITVRCGNQSVSTEITVAGFSDSITPYIAYDFSDAADHMQTIYDNWDATATTYNMTSTGESDLAGVYLNCEVSSNYCNSSIRCQTETNLIAASDNFAMFVGNLSEFMEYSGSNFFIQTAATGNKNNMPTIQNVSGTLTACYGSATVYSITELPTTNWLVMGHDSDGYYLYYDGVVHKSASGTGYIAAVKGIYSTANLLNNENAAAKYINMLRNMQIGVFKADRTQCEKMAKWFGY